MLILRRRGDRRLQHIRAERGRQVLHQPVTAAALAVGIVPAFATLLAATTSAAAEVNPVAGGEADLASSMNSANSQVLVPPAGIGRECGYMILLAQPASQMVKLPALLADYEPAPRALERHHGTPQPSIAEMTTLPQAAADQPPNQSHRGGNGHRPPHHGLMVGAQEACHHAG